MYEIVLFISIFTFSFLFYFFFRKNKIRPPNKSLILIGKLIVLLAGVILVYVNLLEFKHYQNRKSWPMVKGEIISFKIVGIKTREPEIGYRFFVNDSIFERKTNLGTALFGSRKSQEQTARTISGNYRVDDSVMVYYNPGNPQESALKIRPQWNVYIQITFGIFMVSIILALMIPVKLEEDKK